MNKLNIIDLFAGCGGLLDGFLQSSYYNSIASVEWEKAPINTLKNRLLTKWKINEVNESVIRFDIQRIDELFYGFKDENYGESIGLNNVVNNRKIDLIIGGPPCQAYSVAGRVRDKDSMKNDYRNYLFEYYLKVVDKYKPKIFVFENVPGMLSAMPDGTPITTLIKRDIEEKGYEILGNMKKYVVLDTSEYGVPQQRKRVIIIGVNKEYYKNHDIQKMLHDFYNNIITKYKTNIKTLEDAIYDLPPCYPLEQETKVKGRKYSHSIPSTVLSWHFSRFHNKRDIEMFRMLAKDLEDGTNLYINSEIIKQLYNEITGAKTNIHKYHVLRKNKPSTTVLAHLYKDGLRFIHPDYKQARSISVREAARLQTFDDDFEFVGSMGDAYKMIGNAVPPKFAKVLGCAIYDLLEKYE